ncbi:DNA cytosine methyltransferase [Paenibacillus jilunlii]|uniref:DNA (cytosine-5-)-methyltransferase n=1 Tax=Paenibacillus jilunlii TaxID=682956 RepID=A0ABR5STS8_9BACL|nr:DNA (cytosine-5-)-methyltransferase [Paenibacillus jilunlii]KWX73547.1 cytosine methyltransferase [Paenibacillus jilunlii]
MLKVASFFSGIGGFDLGLERAGMEVVFQCEWNAFAQKVLRKHWPNVKLIGDIKDVTIDEVPQAEVWCGGFPCQDVSLANQGKRKGLEGDRSGHFYKYAELIEQGRPDWVIVENVPGLLNSNKGDDFKVVIGTMAELGYGVAWRVLDAKYFGTPQRRRRVYIVASRGSQRASEVLFEQGAITIASRQGLGKKEASASRFSESNLSSTLYAIQHAGIGRKASAGPQAKGYRNDGETYTLDSRGSSDAVCKTDAPFGIRETTGISSGVDANRFRTLGNAVAVPVIEWIGRRLITVAQN